MSDSNIPADTPAPESAAARTVTVLWERVIITGASKGFGNAVTVCYAAAFKAPTHFVLHGRDESQLRTLRDEVLRVRQSVSPPRLTVVELVVMDLGDLSLFDEAALALFVNGLQHQPLVKYSRTTFINNAGSLILGYTGRADSSPSAVEMDSYVRLNQTSPNYLTDCLVKFFSEGKLNTDEVRIVNVSSLVAVQNFPSWGQYSSVKAGREMFHSNVALEWAEDPRLKVLNYAPGPLNTNMQAQIRACETGDPKLRVVFTDMFTTGKLVDPLDSAKKLLRLLVSEKYISGRHVDYYDTIEGVDVGTTGVKDCCACLFCTCVNCECKSLGKPQCDACVVDITLQRCKVERTDVVGK